VLSPGDPMPFCYGMDGNRQFYSFEEQAGRPAVMVLARGLEGGELEQLAASFAHAEEEFARRGADVLVIGDEDVARRWVDNRSRVVDCGSPFLTRCSVLPGRYRVIVVDRSVRVAGVVPDGANDPVGVCLGVLEALPSEPAREVLLPAPVLMVPNLLSREVCGALIEAFETGVSCEGAVASMGLDGVAEARVDYGKKRRRDMPIPPGHPLFAEVQEKLLGRCAPAIAAAFQARVAYTDRILVARYDDTGGYFRRHRDNGAENVAFREFALSVNLNAGEYDGGALCFPEYNDHWYRPGTGAGIIFSASLLHEAMPVTRGRRYVLLTFFHGEAAEARRVAYEVGARCSWARAWKHGGH
jgi:predicted 2-oxoglutarate/Fe(II)-dependent dioxygenase YbiX